MAIVAFEKTIVNCAVNLLSEDDNSEYPYRCDALAKRANSYASWMWPVRRTCRCTVTIRIRFLWHLTCKHKGLETQNVGRMAAHDVENEVDVVVLAGEDDAAG